MTMEVETHPLLNDLFNKKVPKEKNNKLSKDIVNIIRTTQRNNIDLMAIADNKANVLMSLNSLMIAFLVPLILPNIEVIFNNFLYIPLLILGLTCFITIFIAAQVLKPSDFDQFRKEIGKERTFSPFFFGNYYKMKTDEFFDYFKDTLVEPGLVKDHLTQDLYYFGKRLGIKMMWIRRAFNIFIGGIFLVLLSTALLLALT